MMPTWSCRLPLDLALAVATNDLAEPPTPRRRPSILRGPPRHRPVSSSGASLLDPVCVERRRHGLLGPGRSGPRDRPFTVGWGGLTAAHWPAPSPTTIRILSRIVPHIFPRASAPRPAFSR